MSSGMPETAPAADLGPVAAAPGMPETGAGEAPGVAEKSLVSLSPFGLNHDAVCATCVSDCYPQIQKKGFLLIRFTSTINSSIQVQFL